VYSDSEVSEVEVLFPDLVFVVFVVVVLAVRVQVSSSSSAVYVVVGIKVEVDLDVEEGLDSAVNTRVGHVFFVR